jgi:hypothetical protein
MVQRVRTGEKPRAEGFSPPIGAREERRDFGQGLFDRQIADLLYLRAEQVLELRMGLDDEQSIRKP